MTIRAPTRRTRTPEIPSRSCPSSFSTTAGERAKTWTAKLTCAPSFLISSIVVEPGFLPLMTNWLLSLVSLISMIPGEPSEKLRTSRAEIVFVSPTASAISSPIEAASTPFLS